MLVQPHNSQYILRAPVRYDAWQDDYVRAVQLENWRRQQFLLVLADRLVSTLSDALVSKLGVTTTARAVMISAERRRHIFEGRAVVSELDADLAAHKIHEALEDCRYLKAQRKPSIYELIGFSSSADRFILVALKLVPATHSKTREDEWWVQTAHPFRKTTLGRVKAKGQLRSLK